MKGGSIPNIFSPRGRKRTGRPVKWIGERSRGLLSDEQCRDNITEAELALDKDGKFLALRVTNYVQHRRLLSPPTARRPAGQQIGVLAGTYIVAGGLRRGQRRVHQHDADRPLSRRRPAGGRLRGRNNG